MWQLLIEQFKPFKQFGLILFVGFLLVPTTLPAQPANLEEQTRKIASELRCPVCQNLSAGDSPSELAQQMRAIILQQLKEGKSPDQIKAYFVSKYGEWVLLAPEPKGFSLLVWVLPFVALAAGILIVIFVVARWMRQKNRLQTNQADPALIERVQREVAAGEPVPAGLEEESERAPLLHEQARLYADLKELEFDYQAGKLSESDYEELRHDPENQAAMVLKEIDSSAPARSQQKSRESKPRAETEKKVPEKERISRPTWQIVAGGVFLLLFGVTVGVFLTKSLRPRGSEQDTITGGFLTGTGQGDQDTSSLLGQGRAAFEKQEWPKAIEAFKKVLAADANQPEAHTYMGLILAQANHADGALMAFDRALSSDPNFPLALWGKGMLLYREKHDLSGAREALAKLVKLMPAGMEKEEVQKTLDEIAQANGGQNATSKKQQPTPASARIEGTISIDPKLKGKVDTQAVLFIIARSSNSQGGPPLAVKRIEHPVFPLNYTLSHENVMVSGAPFAGKVFISALLDKDGNVMTKEPGNLTGDCKKNPVEIGSLRADVVMDHVM